MAQQPAEEQPAMLSSDEILERAARDGSIDIADWPRVLETLLQKLHHIVHNDFILPTVPPPSRASPPPPGASHTPDPQPPSSADKENAAPRPLAPSFAASSRPDQDQHAAPQLPPDLLDAYTSSRNTLQASFADSPPYTIQRLAELVLFPQRYYRYLPPYLQALDRVVSVTSPLNDFPLAQNINPSGDFLANGDPSEALAEREGLGSDESLGGALLTPITWLKRENGAQELRSEGSQTIEGPNGAGVIETVSVAVNGLPSPAANPAPAAPEQPADDSLTHEQALRAQGSVTQGELLRQEQEAGVVPPGHETPQRSFLVAGAAAVGREDQLARDEEDGERPEEHPHARGPDVIGAEDMGPQDAAIGVTRPLNMEAAVGRAQSPDVVRDAKDAEGDSALPDLGTEEQKQDEVPKEADLLMSDAS